MNNVCGFVEIKKDATTCKGAKNPNEFIGEICPVFEFAEDGGVLVLNPKGTALAMFDKEDIKRGFKCGYINGVVTPPNLDFTDQMLYITKAKTRKGGYEPILANMVIHASLLKGEFSDNFLWQRQ